MRITAEGISYAKLHHPHLSKKRFDGLCLSELGTKIIDVQPDFVVNTEFELISKLKNKYIYATRYTGLKWEGYELTSNQFTAELEGTETWSTMGDSTVCPSCNQMNEQEVEIGEYFKFTTSSKTYELNGPPLHGFNESGGKQIPNANPGTEDDATGRFSNPTCRCITITVNFEELLDDEDVPEGLTFIEDEVVDSFGEFGETYFNNVVKPLHDMISEGITTVPDELIIQVLERGGAEQTDLADLVFEIKEQKELLTVLKKYNLID